MFRCGWRKPLAAGTVAWRGGKRSTAGAGAGAAAREVDGLNAGLKEEDVAACATRSSTCPEDWCVEREAVDCLALSSLPPVMPDHCVPDPEGTSSGNWLRCYYCQLS